MKSLSAQSSAFQRRFFIPVQSCHPARAAPPIRFLFPVTPAIVGPRLCRLETGSGSGPRPAV